MKNEWTEQDLRQFVESSRPVFQDVSLTQMDEDADRCWQDDGLMVDYELRGGAGGLCAAPLCRGRRQGVAAADDGPSGRQ